MHLWSLWADTVLFWDLGIPVSLGSDLGALFFASGRFVTKVKLKLLSGMEDHDEDMQISVWTVMLF